MSNSFDPDQARRFVEPGLGQNCLQRLTADDTSRRTVKLFKTKKPARTANNEKDVFKSGIVSLN